MAHSIGVHSHLDTKSTLANSSLQTLRRSNTARPDFMIKKHSAAISENSPAASDRLFKRSSSIFKGKIVVSRANTQEDDAGQSTRQSVAIRPALNSIANSQRKTRFDSPIRNLKPQRGVEAVEVLTPTEQQALDGKLLGKVVRELKAQLSRLNETDREIEQALQYQYSIPTYLSNIYVHHVNKLVRLTKANQEVMVDVGQQLKNSINQALKTYQSRKSLLSEASFQTLTSPSSSKNGKQNRSLKEFKTAAALRKVQSEKLRFSIAPMQVQESAHHLSQQTPESKQTPQGEFQSSLASTDSPGIFANQTSPAFFSQHEQRKPKFTLRPSLKTQPNTIEFTRLQSQFSNKLDSEQSQIKIKRTVRFLDVEIERPTDGCEQKGSDRQ